MLKKILTILFFVLAVAATLVAYYFYIRAKLEAAIAENVNKAEDLEGAEVKRAQAIADLAELIPPILKPFISKKAIGKMLEAAFLSIEAYAEKQIKKKGGGNATTKKE